MSVKPGARAREEKLENIRYARHAFGYAAMKNISRFAGRSVKSRGKENFNCAIGIRLDSLGMYYDRFLATVQTEGRRESDRSGNYRRGMLRALMRLNNIVIKCIRS